MRYVNWGLGPRNRLIHDDPRPGEAKLQRDFEHDTEPRGVSPNICRTVKVAVRGVKDQATLGEPSVSITSETVE